MNRGPIRKKERLLERIEELERMQQQKQEPLSGMEEKMALMEKSYELAAKYNNRQAVETPSPVRKAEDKKAIPVKQVHNEVVSSLSRPVSDEEFISAFSGERNAGFNTAVGRKTVTEGNTIAACVHGTQTVSDGQALRLRLTEPMSVAGRFIPKGTVLVGGTRIQGERLEIMVNAVEYKGTILPVELEVYDLDGQQGILVPGSLEYDAAREIAANMGTSMKQQHQHFHRCRGADCLRSGKRCDTGRFPVHIQTDAYGKDYFEGRTPGTAPFTGEMKYRKL